MPQLLFDSVPFIFLFMPVGLLLYWGIGLFGLPLKTCGEIRRIILIILSVIFYASFGIYNLSLLLLSIFTNLCIFLCMKKNSRKNPAAAVGVIANIVFLCFFKYSGSFLESSLILPLGISFYTFQQISFLLDMRENDADDVGTADYLLYILYFPKLLEGPIVRYADFRGAFKGLADLSFTDRKEKMLRAGVLFVFGLAKKILIADTLTNAVDIAFEGTASLYWADAVILFFTYLPSLYFDFSGYCDMGMAVSELFGIPLPYNFDRPFLATNVVDFWQRWHSSLSRFFTKYIYIPMGGSRRGLLRTMMNSFLIFFISGLWHGVGLTFIVWGCMHGGLYVVTRLYREMRKKKTEKKGASGKNLFDRLPNQLRALPMYLYAAASFVFFRADSMTDAINVFRKIFSKPWKPMTIKFVEGFERNEIWYVIKMTPLGKQEWSPYICMWLMLAIAYGLTFFSPKAGDLADMVTSRIVGTEKQSGLYGIVFGILFVWCVLSLSGVSSFAYFNF